MAQGIEYDENRVVALDKSSAMMGYDESRVAYDEGRVLAELAFFDPLALAYDEGKIVDQPTSPFELAYDRRVAVDFGRPLVMGTTIEPLIPLRPDPDLVMLGELQANRVQAQRQDVSIHKT